MKLTDYVIDFLVKQGIEKVFGVTGGGVVHLFDSADKNPGIQPVFCHHEQSAALAAVSYAKARNDLSAAMVTTGPGGTNTITGVTAAWQDSIPCIFISGQSRSSHMSHGTPLRQVGTQEFDIVSLVRRITKYAEVVEEADRIRYHMEKAVYLAREGRPGPTWIDIPLNFQWAAVQPHLLPGFDSSQLQDNSPPAESIAEACANCVELLKEAKRPLLLNGYGIRLAHAVDEFRELFKILNIPFVSSWTASDMSRFDNPLFIGRVGIAGQRGANLAIQNCNLLICIGSHLSIPMTGTMFDAFARETKVVMVNIDKDVLDFETVKVDFPIQCDAKLFLSEMLRQVKSVELGGFESWRKKCLHYKSYNEIPGEWWEETEYVNPYVFMDTLSDALKDDNIVVDGGGTNMYISFQGLKLKGQQRLILSTSICAMGTGLPESIGVCFATNKSRTICTIGDGSMQLNIQELQTIVHYKLPVKIFVMNNGGYLAIRHTQTVFLEQNYVGSSKNGGLTLPDYMKVGQAYGLKTIRIHNNRELSQKLQWALEEDGPVLCEIMVSPEQQVIPQQGYDRNADGTFSPRPLEDMYPYLDRKEFLENMIVRPWSK